jgi:hypothetical protein
MIYQPLNRGSNEIRVFSFYFDSIPGSSDCLTSQSLFDDPIYCNLENVSLDAVSPSYREFLSTPNSSSWDDSFCKIISYRECNIKKGGRQKHKHQVIRRCAGLDTSGVILKRSLIPGGSQKQHAL